MPPPIGRVHDSLESLGGESSGDLPKTIAGGGRDSVRKSGRRRSVLLSVGRLSEEELRERRARRQAAGKGVREALAAEDASHKLSRPLKRFGCSLSFTLVYHTRTDKKTAKTVRRTVLHADNFKFSMLPKEVARALKMTEAEAKQLTYSYYNKRGHGVRIDKQGAMTGWLDEMWDRHPPELHVHNMQSMVAESEERMALMHDIFAEYDTDGSGSLSVREVKEMILRLKLTESLGVSREDLATYINDEFKRADVDRSGEMDFEEFVGYFNGLQDYLQDSLARENKFVHTSLKFREAFCHAHSAWTPLGELVDKGGTLLLDLHGHDYGVEVRITEEAVPKGDEELRRSRVCAQTLLDHSVDYFEDNTESLGVLASPIVWVRFENKLDDTTYYTELDESYHVKMPHCLVDKEVTKDDLVVVYATFDDAIWEEVSPECYQLLPGNDMTNLAPSVVVEMIDAGVVAVYTRNDRKPRVRVQCLAYVPSQIIPLESERLRIYLAPALPDQLKVVEHIEMQDRGDASLGGKFESASELLGFRLGTAVELAIQQEEREAHSLQWTGELQWMDFELDPHFLMKEEQELAKAHAEDSVKRETLTSTASLTATVSTRDLRSNTQRRFSIAARNTHRTQNRAALPITLKIHAFPPPSAPREVFIHARNNTALCIRWRHPASWGGCALSHYEVQIREVTNKGKQLEWETVAAEARAGFGGLGIFDLARNIFKCEVRVRAYNVASEAASEWSKVVNVLSEKEEKERSFAATKMQAAHRGSQIRRRNSVVGTENEGGVATVSRVEEKSSAATRRSTIMGGWSSFKRAIGEFYLEAGVAGGVDGFLFDLSPSQVEEFVAHNSDAGATDKLLSRDKPLMSLARIAVWVLATLAHHTENSVEWIEFMNAAEGLVTLAIKRGGGAATSDAGRGKVGALRGAAMSSRAAEAAHYEKGLLYALVEVYETLKQCEPGGYITKQLAHKYDKKLRRLLNDDWEARFEALHNDLSVQVMSMLLHQRKVDLLAAGKTTLDTMDEYDEDPAAAPAPAATLDDF